jgi:hypothetical protein
MGAPYEYSSFVLGIVWSRIQPEEIIYKSVSLRDAIGVVYVPDGILRNISRVGVALLSAHTPSNV